MDYCEKTAVHKLGISPVFVAGTDWTKPFEDIVRTGLSVQNCPSLILRIKASTWQSLVLKSSFQTHIPPLLFLFCVCWNICCFRMPHHYILALAMNTRKFVNIKITCCSRKLAGCPQKAKSICYPVHIINLIYSICVVKATSAAYICESQNSASLIIATLHLVPLEKTFQGLQSFSR